MAYIWKQLIGPFRQPALRKGTMPNDNMALTRIVKRILMVQ